MRAVIQRCNNASVEVDGKIVGKIDKGLTVFLGLKVDDTINELEYMLRKISGIRIFEDENCKMNKSPLDVSAEILIISNFTLYGDMSAGFRPSFIEAMRLTPAEDMFNLFLTKIKQQNVFKKVQCGIFGADMKVEVSNDGPVTIIIDTENLK